MDDQNNLNGKRISSKEMENKAYSVIDSKIYDEPEEHLIKLYYKINGVRSVPPNISKPECHKFLDKLLTIKLNHVDLVKKIEKGNLVKFDQLVVWGRNLNRKVEDLIKDYLPRGYRPNEAKEFVLMMINNETRYRQCLANNNEEDMFANSSYYKYDCLACDRRDDNLTWFVAHLCRDTAEIIYVCTYCGFMFFNNICCLIYHVLLDEIDGPKPKLCFECLNLFPNLSNHLMDTGGSWKQICSYCNFVALSKCSYYIHVRYHKKEKYFVCPECGALFIFFESLEEHLKNVCHFDAKNLRYMCSICSIIFKDKNFFLQHLLNFHHHRLIKCIQCHIVLKNKYQYVAHRKLKHPESPCSYYVSHICNFCPGSKFNSSAVQAHMKNHSDDASNVIIVYICRCNFYTIHKYKFIEHRTKRCIATCSFGKWEQPHEMKICPSCHDIKFVNISEPFVCEYCEVLENRSIIKAYECNTCKYLITYCWDAVIEHFFRNHHNIPHKKFCACVKVISFTDKYSMLPLSIDN